MLKWMECILPWGARRGEKSKGNGWKFWKRRVKASKDISPATASSSPGQPANVRPPLADSTNNTRSNASPERQAGATPPPADSLNNSQGSLSPEEDNRSQPTIRASQGSSSPRPPTIMELADAALSTMDRGSLREEPSEDVNALVARLILVLRDVQQYKQLLTYRDSEAHKLVDVFQLLLDTAKLSEDFRSTLLVAIRRLSTKAGVYPTRYDLTDIVLASEEPFAAGGFADVWQGRHHGQVVCVKVVRLYQSSHVGSLLKRLSAEVILWGNLSHPNLVPFYGLYRYRERLCLVYSWMEHDIREFMRRNPNADRISLVSDVAAGIAYLHTLDIVHGDLKGSNVFVNSARRACLTDFGLSQMFDPDIIHWTSHSSLSSKGGTIRWQAPELLDGEGDNVARSSKASDIYAFSCVAYEIFTGNVPFVELNRDIVVLLKVTSGARPSRPPESSPAWGAWGLTEPFWSLMQECWSQAPSDRPTIDNIVARYLSVDHKPFENVGVVPPVRPGDSVNVLPNTPPINTADAPLDGIDTILDYGRQAVAHAEEEPPENVKALVEKLRVMFSNVEQYKRLLSYRDSEAQKLLDTFQTLLDTVGLSAEFRRNLLVATQRLARETGLFPMRYNLKDTILSSDVPVAVGISADVYKGNLQGQVVCVKVMRLAQTSDVVALLKHFSAEAILWGQLSHPNLLPFFGLYWHTTRLCLVSPWMEHGDIIQFLNLHRDANRTLLVSDIASGVAYLHEHDIIHGDLKGPNILVNGARRACVADFGLSAVSDKKILYWTLHSSPASKGGSLRWQAPELFDPEGDDVVHNSKSSDVYALTCVAYEIYTGNLPFFEMRNDTAVIFKVRAGSQPSRPPTLSQAWGPWGLTEALWSLMQTCWKANPSDRPTIHDIVAHYASTKPTDDRPIDHVDATHFRGSMGARSDLPSIDDIVALLASMNMNAGVDS